MTIDGKPEVLDPADFLWVCVPMVGPVTLQMDLSLVFVTESRCFAEVNWLAHGLCMAGQGPQASWLPWPAGPLVP